MYTNVCILDLPNNIYWKCIFGAESAKILYFKSCHFLKYSEIVKFAVLIVFDLHWFSVLNSHFEFPVRTWRGLRGIVLPPHP